MNNSLEREVLGVLLDYEATIAAVKGNGPATYPRPNLEEALNRDRNFDPAFEEVLQSLQDRGYISRQADCYYRLTASGVTYSKR